MKTYAAIVTYIAVLLIVGFVGAETFIDAVMPVPTGQQVFNYQSVSAPVAGNSPSTMKPLGVGTVAGGGSIISLRLTMGQFAKPVDIYVGYYAPAIDDENTYLFTKNAIQPLSAGLVPWKKAVTGTDDILAGDIRTEDLPEGKYTFYILVTLPDIISEYYLWITEFTIKSGGDPSFSFTLTSNAGVNGGTLPVEYTCDGAGASPALTWSNAPSGTQEFALMMTTLPGDGTTKWSWVLYHIPATTTGLVRNSSGVGISGVTHGSNMDYEPPCSQGPGAKIYTFTLYALSASPSLPGAASQVTGEVLTKAISGITIGSASLNLSYTRQ